LGHRPYLFPVTYNLYPVTYPPLPHLFLQELQDHPRYFFAVCITVVVSICIHELAHGIVAIAFGDRTPIETGHMTLNPAVHMRGMAIILLLVAGIAWGSMPVDRSRLRGRYAGSLVALAGPATNALLALLSIGGLALWLRYAGPAPDSEPAASSLRFFLLIFGVTNIALAMFNLIPVPPLDGSNILAGLSPAFAGMMRNLRSGGGATVVFLLLFMFAGNLIFPASQKLALDYLRWVRGW
jgi:Zn-dependent protease